MISKSGLAALAVLVRHTLGCAPSYPGPHTPSVIVPGAAIAARGTLQRTAGCWRFRFPNRSVPFLPDSALLSLDTTSVHGQPPNARHVARLIAVSPPNESIGAEWAPFGPDDSVYVLLGTPSNGVRMRVGYVGDSLGGVGQTWDDTFTYMRSVPIAARRSSCVSRPPQN